MLVELFLWAFLSQPEALCTPQIGRQIVTQTLGIEARKRLPRGLLLAIVLAESGGRHNIIHYPKVGGYDCGVGQIHVDYLMACFEIMHIKKNLNKAATILTWSRGKCKRNPELDWCQKSEGWGLYNSGNAEGWWRRVKDIRLRLLESVRRRSDQKAIKVAL